MNSGYDEWSQIGVPAHLRGKQTTIARPTTDQLGEPVAGERRGSRFNPLRGANNIGETAEVRPVEVVVNGRAVTERTGNPEISREAIEAEVKRFRAKLDERLRAWAGEVEELFENPVKRRWLLRGAVGVAIGSVVESMAASSQRSALALNRQAADELAQHFGSPAAALESIVTKRPIASRMWGVAECLAKDTIRTSDHVYIPGGKPHPVHRWTEALRDLRNGSDVTPRMQLDAVGLLNASSARGEAALLAGTLLGAIADSAPERKRPAWRDLEWQAFAIAHAADVPEARYFLAEMCRGQNLETAISYTEGPTTRPVPGLSRLRAQLLTQKAIATGDHTDGFVAASAWVEAQRVGEVNAENSAMAQAVAAYSTGNLDYAQQMAQGFGRRSWARQMQAQVAMMQLPPSPSSSDFDRVRDLLRAPNVVSRVERNLQLSPDMGETDDTSVDETMILRQAINGAQAGAGTFRELIGEGSSPGTPHPFVLSGWNRDEARPDMQLVTPFLVPEGMILGGPV